MRPANGNIELAGIFTTAELIEGDNPLQQHNIRLCCNILMICITTIILWFATKANLDLTAGSYVLFSDEKLFTNNIISIYEANGWQQFLRALVFGDQFYGRIFYFFHSIIGFLPYHFYGEPGLIFAARSASTLGLLSSYVILTLHFLKHPILRLMTFFTLVTLPNTIFFATYPRTEVVLLLCFSIFLVLWERDKLGFGWYWLFLGLAIAAKISFLPVIGIVSAISFFYRRESKFCWSRLAIAMLSAITAWLLSIPIILAGQLGIWKAYIRSATLGQHDDSTVNFVAWMYRVNKVLFSNSPMIFPIIASLSLSLLGFSIWQLGDKTKDDKQLESIRVALLLIFIGLSQVVFISVIMKRIRIYYLHIGIVLLIIGMFSLSEYILGKSADLKIKLATIALFVVLFTTSLIRIPQMAENLAVLMERTKAKNYQLNIISYQEVAATMAKISTKLSQPMRVFYDGNLFSPHSSQKTNIELFWPPFRRWEQQPDVLIFSSESIPSSWTLPEKTEREYLSYVLGKQEYNTHVSRSGVCSASPCYDVLLSKKNVQILIRHELMPLLKLNEI
jgi:hypothetical protein